VRIFWEKEYPFASDIDSQEILSLTVYKDLICVVGKQPPDSLNSMDDRLGISLNTVFITIPLFSEYFLFCLAACCFYLVPFLRSFTGIPNSSG